MQVLESWLRAYEPAAGNLKLWSALEQVDLEFPELRDITSLFRTRHGRGRGPTDPRHSAQAAGPRSHRPHRSHGTGTPESIIRPGTADSLKPSALTHSLTPRAPLLFNPEHLLSSSGRTHVLPRGVLETALKADVYDLLLWGEILETVEHRKLHRRYIGGSFCRFSRKYLGFTHHGVAARMIELARVIWRAAVEVTSDAGGDPDVIVGALKPPLLAALLGGAIAEVGIGRGCSGGRSSMPFFAGCCTQRMARSASASRCRSRSRTGGAQGLASAGACSYSTVES